MTEEVKESIERPDKWMLKPCEWYKEEYKDCRCLRARFNQHFIYGEPLDCSQWKVDHENCELWKSKDDTEAYNALLASEKQRRLKRLKSHYGNDTWTKRDKPPDNWNAPLPEWMEKEHKSSYLYVKQKGLETGDINDFDMKIPTCTIL